MRAKAKPRESKDNAAAKQQVSATYRRFMAEVDPDRKKEAGKDLIRAIFGAHALAENSIR